MQISYENLCVLFMKQKMSRANNVCDSFRSDDVEI